MKNIAPLERLSIWVQRERTRRIMSAAEKVYQRKVHAFVKRFCKKYDLVFHCRPDGRWKFYSRFKGSPPLPPVVTPVGTRNGDYVDFDVPPDFVKTPTFIAEANRVWKLLEDDVDGYMPELGTLIGSIR